MARARLKPRHHPYWRGLAPGFHLGYYCGKRLGKWVVRYRQPGSDEPYVTETLGQADDLVQADGRAILSWSQAFEKATAWVKRQRNANPLADGRITVRQAVELYTGVRDDRDTKRRGRIVRSDAASRLTLHVLSDSHLPGTKMADLSEGDLRNWQRRLGELKSTTKQRLINDLKAALNAAYLDNRLALPVDLAQTIKVGLRPVFVEDVAEPTARVDQVLSDEQVRRIVHAATEIDEDGDFGRLVLVLATTGARFSQVKRMLVQDVQPEQSRLLIPRSHKGRGRDRNYIRMPVAPDVIESLAPAIEGRASDEMLLERWRVRQVKATEWVRVGRGPWNAASEMTRKWQALREMVDLPPDIVPYALRHSSIVRGLTHDLPIRLVAALHDTSVAMIERYYSRWITDSLEDLASTAAIPMKSEESCEAR